MITSRNQIREKAEQTLGKNEVSELLSQSVKEAHDRYGKAYQRTNKEKMEAYDAVITLKMMGVKS